MADFSASQLIGACSLNFANQNHLDFAGSYTHTHKSAIDLIRVAESPAAQDSLLERDTFQPCCCLDPLSLSFRKFLFFPFHPFVFVYQHLSHD